MISFEVGDVRHHTLACRVRVCMDRAMPEHIARALVRGPVLSLARAFQTCAFDCAYGIRGALYSRGVATGII